jgi:hypothetical protein
LVNIIFLSLHKFYINNGFSRLHSYHTAGWDTIFLYLLTLEVDLIEILEIMPQMWQYVIFFKAWNQQRWLRLYFELVEKSCRGRHNSEILEANTKTLMDLRPGVPGVSKGALGSTKHAIWGLVR